MRRPAALAALPLALSVFSANAADLPPVHKAPASSLAQWTIAASFDLISLERRKGAAIPLATGLSSDDLNLGSSKGADAKIEVGFGNVGVAARHIGHFEWSDLQATTATTLFTTPNINFGSRLVPVGYRSDLGSWEIGAFWQPWSRVKVFGGYREFRVSETLFADLTAATFTVATSNRLAGFQAGLTARLFEGNIVSPALGGLYGDVTGRWGRYRNSVSLAHLPVGVGGAVASFKEESTNTNAIELEAKIGYALSPNADIHVGYRYLRFDRLVLAPENYTSVNIATGVGAPAYSKAEYQGFFGGLQIGF
jgi:hypothetical protein